MTVLEGITVLKVTIFKIAGFPCVCVVYTQSQQQYMYNVEERNDLVSLITRTSGSQLMFCCYLPNLNLPEQQLS